MKPIGNLLLLAAAAFTTCAAPAFAGSNTANVNITSSVVANCTAFTPAGSLAFSSYDAFSTSDVTGSTSLTTRCTKGSSPSFSVSGGGNYSNANPSGDRAMKDSGTDYLTYQLYQDSGHANAWVFDTTSGTGTPVGQTPNGNGADMTLSLYGVIPHGQDAVVNASYSDTVVVTVSF